MKLSPLGYPVISDSLHNTVFGGESRPVMTNQAKRKAINLLKQFKIPTPVDFPDGLYNGDLPLPALRGANLKEHFESVATEQVGHFKVLGDAFSKCVLPSLPPVEEHVLRAGWTRYELVGKKWVTERVPYPLEEAFIFDTETFVQGGNFPVIGTALSAKASYVWLASELLDPAIPQDVWDQYSLIPVGKDKFIAGHNVSFDRVRSQEGYSLENTKPENFWFDTLSAHIGVSGLASNQRWLYVLAGKDPDNLTEEEKRKLRFAPKWLEQGSTNSLVQCYNFHVVAVKNFFGEQRQELGAADKLIRDIFVKATELGQIRDLITPAIDYALKDVYYTGELFQALWEKYLDATPSMVGLAGHYHLAGSVIPLVPDWSEWIGRVEKVYLEHQEEMDKICKDLMWDLYEEWKSAEDKSGIEVRDPWTSQLDWEVKATRGKYAGVPSWIRKYTKDPDEKIGVRAILSHLLLRLKWEGSPMFITEDDGWCFHNADGELTKIPHPKGKGANVGGVFSKDFVGDMEVGRLSSDLPEARRALAISNAISYWTSVRSRTQERIFLKTANPHGADAVITLPEILPHGTVTRRTVESLMVTMCSTKNWRIGTELKTRVQAPDGWKVVGADFDGQELQIASIYSDKWEGGHIGCSPFGYNVLSGAKEAGTDPHTALAKSVMPELYKGLVWDRKLGICCTDGGELVPVSKEKAKELSYARDTAKMLKFSVLYGAGARGVQNYVQIRFPQKPVNEAKQWAYTSIATMKGVLKQGVYEDGIDSGAYNFMEGIAMRSRLPQLPCLGTKISTAMRPSAVGSDFKTSRVNWAIQASGSEILSIILTATQWLSLEYKVPCRFIISIHDEVWFMAPEKYAEQFAVLFQVAHLYTWALFHHRIGIPDVPLSRAFFSSVAIDDRLRKSPHENTVTPSNPQGAGEPAGVEYTMADLAECGAIAKLTTRFNAIQKGLL